jgi:hypothetical protein
MSTIYWHENPAFDAPELNSPQPCIHGGGCVFTVKDAEGKTIPGCCRYVHPGEEGTGRRLFPARTMTFEHPDGEHVVNQPAYVRLTGNAGFYERRRLKMSWQAWCAREGIPFVRNEPGVKHAPVKRIPFAAKKVITVKKPVNIMADAASWPPLPQRDLSGLARQLTEGAVKSFNDPVRQQQLFEEMRTRLAAAGARTAEAEAAAADAEAADAEAAAARALPSGTKAMWAHAALCAAAVKQAQDEGELVDGWGGEDGSHSPRPWRSSTSHVVDDDDYYEEDSKCTFCGAMESECGGDHADEMRDLLREALRRDY